MTRVIITCNAGSSNTKLAVFECHPGAGRDPSLKLSHTVYNQEEALSWLKNNIGMDPVLRGDDIIIGHRVVHGGDTFVKPTLITPNILEQLAEFNPLAPLHQPIALDFIKKTSQLFPNTPQIACFDTAFHHTMPEIEKILPLPRIYYDSGIKRYGFHGLSYEYIASALPDSLQDKRVMVAHLGNGSSVCAMKNGQSIATSMGFSTLDGLMMGTRCGALDPGVILHLLQHKNMSVSDIEKLLYKQSGLLGVSGISSDMRELEASDKPEAKLAIELYCHNAAKQLSSLIPSIGGIDGIIFTGGIGEHAANVREKILSHLAWLGEIEVLVIPTNEELVIAKACRKITS